MRSIVGGTGSYVAAEEMVLVAGATGEVLARRPLPEMEEAVQKSDLCVTGGNLTGPGRRDFLLREWRSDAGGGGFHLWAYDSELRELWRRRVETPYGHGWAVQFCDVDGDGRDELLAGGTLYSAEGDVLWTHDLAEEMARIHGAHHYDAVYIGFLADDPEVDPVAFLLGGSAGVYVVDGLTGRTRRVHRVGHAQGRQVGRLRGDLPGQQVMVVCRWGNMGIQTLFSGSGDRLWSIQPDYLGQGSCPVSWGPREEQLLWVNTTGPAQAFYDGYGRKVKDLPLLRELWGNAMRRDVATFTVRLGRDPQECLGLGKEGTLYVFGPGFEG